MRTILFILQKEFKQIFRNRGMLPIIFIMPIVQLIVLAQAATFEIHNLKLFIVDNDHSSYSRLLRTKFEGSNYFINTGFSQNPDDGESALMRDEADLILNIPPHFERDLMRGEGGSVQLVVNAIDGVKAGLANAYAGNMIADFNREIATTQQAKTVRLTSTPATSFYQLNITHANWYNPELEYTTFMVPGILVLLVTMIGAFLTSMNVVREKEIGTIEQLNVTPIQKYQFIVGKLLPFWLIGMFDLTLGLIVAKLIYNIPIVGNIGVIYAFAALYLIVVEGLGLLISTLAETQQQAMFIAWFFLVIFILLSGLFTAIENMPNWAQTITLLNPVRYFIEVTRMVMLKGAGLAHIQQHFMILLAYAAVINGLAIWRYQKTV